MEIPPQESFKTSELLKTLNGFDNRIIRQTREIYESLPDVTGMHFTQVDQIDSIKEKGFVAAEKPANFLYVFDKKDTDEYYGHKLEKADKAGLVHYDVLETIKRFHSTFIEGLKKYGMEGLRIKLDASSQSVRDYMIANKVDLPAVVFADLSGANFPRKGISADRLSQGYITDLNNKNIINTICIDEGDIDEITEDIGRGVSITDACKKIMVNKTVEWLLLKAEASKQERIEMLDKKYEEEIKRNPLLEWRKPFDKEFGSDVVDKIVASIRGREDIRTGDKSIQDIASVEYLPPGAITHSRIIMNQIRSKKEFLRILDEYSTEDKKLAKSLQVHSFGGSEIIRLDKCKTAELLKAEANTRFGRPAESLIYFGSLDDIELPLLAGVKEIYMVDPGLGDEFIKGMIARVDHYGKNILYDEAKKVLTFDLESRNIIAKIFQETMREFNDRMNIQAEEVLMYNKAHGMDTAEARKALLPGGFCMDNRSDNMI